MTPLLYFGPAAVNLAACVSSSPKSSWPATASSKESRRALSRAAASGGSRRHSRARTAAGTAGAARAAARAAHHQGGRQGLVAALMGVARLDGAQQPLHGAGAELGYRNADRGQRRGHVAGDRDVVEACQRQVAGDADAGLAQRVQ